MGSRHMTRLAQRFFLRILILTALLVMLACGRHGTGTQELAASRGVRDGFYFVQISDTHFGDRDHLGRTRKLVDQINALPYDILCVVHTGDIFADNVTDAAVRQEGLDLLRRLKAPLHLLPGNHDILEAQLDSSLRDYTREVGPLIHQAEYKGVVFVFAYTEPAAKGFTISDYDPLKAVAAAFQHAAGKPIIFFHHRPAVDDYYEFAAHPGWDVNARSALETLLRAHRVRAVVTGHFHRDELHWLDDIPIFSAGPVAGYWGRQASFRLYDYRDGRLGYRTVYLRE
jgi:3',5'-cyclic AMP phosphodiesterase CpdA